MTHARKTFQMLLFYGCIILADQFKFSNRYCIASDRADDILSDENSDALREIDAFALVSARPVTSISRSNDGHSLVAPQSNDHSSVSITQDGLNSSSSDININSVDLASSSSTSSSTSCSGVLQPGMVIKKDPEGSFAISHRNGSTSSLNLDGMSLSPPDGAPINGNGISNHGGRDIESNTSDVSSNTLEHNNNSNNSSSTSYKINTNHNNNNFQSNSNNLDEATDRISGLSRLLLLLHAGITIADLYLGCLEVYIDSSTSSITRSYITYSYSFNYTIIV
jgi:hypothetical protein